MKVKSSFQIIDQKIIYMNKNFMAEIETLKANDGQYGECVFEIIDRVQHFQHKYYRGPLIDEICGKVGERDTEYIHFEMKKKFLYREVESAKDIKSRYRGRCIVFMNDNAEVKAYIPSTGDLTFEEMRDYILKVEEFLIHEINGSMPVENLHDRSLALGQ